MTLDITKVAQVPPWLRLFISDTNIHDLSLSVLGEKALIAKQLEIETYNLDVGARLQKRVPETLSIYETAILLMSRFTFRNVYTDKAYENTQLAIYITDGPKKGIYSTLMRDLSNRIFQVVPTYESRQRKEVYLTIEEMAPAVKQSESPYLTAVNNGIFDKEHQVLHDFNSSYVFLSKLRTDYNPNAKRPTYTFSDGVSWTPDELFQVASDDPDVETLLWQVAADFFQPNVTRERSIFLYSEKGNNGKGTYGTMLESIVGKNNVAHLAVDDFNHEFLKESLIGKVGNIAHENNVNDYVDNVRDFKAIITGDDITINRKYEKPIHLQFKGTNIQMFNGLPKTKDKSASFYRRLLLVPFNRSFTNNGQRPEIKNEFIHQQDVREYILMQALHLQFNEFIEPSQSIDALRQYKEENDPVIEFWEELQEEFVWDLLPSAFLYDLFVEYHKRNNPSGRPISRQSFLSQLRYHLEGDTEWADSTSKTVRSKNNMDKDEPLITEYGLSNWFDKSYRGADLSRLRNFSRKPNYRGFVRK